MHTRSTPPCRRQQRPAQRHQPPTAFPPPRRHCPQGAADPQHPERHPVCHGQRRDCDGDGWSPIDRNSAVTADLVCAARPRADAGTGRNSTGSYRTGGRCSAGAPSFCTDEAPPEAAAGAGAEACCTRARAAHRWSRTGTAHSKHTQAPPRRRTLSNVRRSRSAATPDKQPATASSLSLTTPSTIAHSATPSAGST
eukprot:7383578-Prymnesium_polylepis.1